MGGDGFGMGSGMGFGGIFMWIFWIALIVLVVWATSSALGGRGDSRRQSGKSALEILEERYAKGEIEREEFERKRKDLTG